MFRKLWSGALAALIPIFLVSMTAPASSAGTAPRAVITGSSAGIPGDLIIISGEESVATIFEWKVVCRDRPNTRVAYRLSADGKKFELQSYAGTYDVVLMVANDSGIDSAEWTITILPLQPDGRPLPAPRPIPVPPNPGPAPNPGPTPGPDPAPNPPAPPGPTPPPAPPTPPTPPAPSKYGLEEKVREWAKGVNRPDEAKAIAKGLDRLADELETQAAAIAAGTQQKPNAATFPQVVVNKVASENKLALNGNLAPWSSFWKDKVAGAVMTLIPKIDPGSPADWSVLVREIAKGLKP